MSDFLTVFFGTIVLSSMVIIVHLKAAYHPYHNPIPLIISSLTVMLTGIFASSIINSNLTYLDSMRVSVSESIIAILGISPLIYLAIFIILAKVSVSTSEIDFQ